jgi:hypothetical protein
MPFSAKVTSTKRNIMQYAMSPGQNQSQGQVQSSGKRPAIIAGLGAAVVAAVITLVLSTSGGSSPVATSEGASATQSNQCSLIQRKLYVSTTTGGGTVRLRDGNYVSPPITLSAQRQPVVFPLPRPGENPLDDVITIEGNSSDVVITSDFNPNPRVFNVVGLSAFAVTWKPMKGC